MTPPSSPVPAPSHSPGPDALTATGTADPTPMLSAHDPRLLGELTLLHSPGLGPVLATRLIERLGSPEHATHLSEALLRAVPGIGQARAAAIRAALPGARDAAARELDRAAQLGVRLITIDDPHYPPLLRGIPNPPRILFVRGSLSPQHSIHTAGQPGHWHALGIVGTRRCTAYGIEQAERFAAAIASAGISIVSGGARGIDTAAHRAALRVRGHTVAVLGCGLAHDYPPENTPLFERIAAEAGAIVSELPLDTPPISDNFPARNRIISGLSLGVLVVEAPLRSGSLITAREAIEQHGREVMVVPGRVDSAASAGSLALIRDGAALVVTPADVIATLEAGARHQFHGTHDIFTGTLFPDSVGAHADTHASIHTEPAHPPLRDADTTGITDAAQHAAPPTDATPPLAPPVSSEPAAILAALREPADPDAIARATGLPSHRIRAHLTMLELTGKVIRRGTRFEVRSS